MVVVVAVPVIFPCWLELFCHTGMEGHGGALFDDFLVFDWMDVL